jgi:hypothetical protein
MAPYSLTRYAEHLTRWLLFKNFKSNHKSRKPIQKFQYSATKIYLSIFEIPEIIS